MGIYGWQRYLGIERDFMAAQFYISFDIKEAYSEFFTRETILLGAEIEAAMKELCYRIDGFHPGRMNEYKEIILKSYPLFSDITVKDKKTNEIEKPFEE